MRQGQAPLIRRIDEALEICRAATPNSPGPLTQTLLDARARAEAWLCSHDAPGPAVAEGVVLLATSVGGAPKREFRLIPFGEVEVERPLVGETFAFTPQHAESAVRWFERMGRKLAIDYEHQSFERFNNRPDGLRPAAGWIGGLEARDDGLWAVDVEWTERATELLRSGEYRYFSPVIYWSDEDQRELASLGPVALTNDPAMRRATTLAGARREEGDAAPREDGALLRTALRAAEEEVVLLKRHIAAVKADAFIEQGMRLGKIVDANSMDWRADYLRDADDAEQRLSRSPVLLPPGRILAADPHVVGRRGPSAFSELYRDWGIDAADLDAYERATAAGRVRCYGDQPSARRLRNCELR